MRQLDLMNFILAYYVESSSSASFFSDAFAVLLSEWFAHISLPYFWTSYSSYLVYISSIQKRNGEATYLYEISLEQAVALVSSQRSHHHQASSVRALSVTIDKRSAHLGQTLEAVQDYS